MSERVTEIIRTAVPDAFAYYTQEGCERGSRIHANIALYETTGRVEFSDEREYRALQGWIAFRKATPDWAIVANERRLHNDQYGYEGHPDWMFADRVGRIIVDVKTGSPADWHRWQVAAYTMCDEVCPCRGVVLYLKPMGGWSLSTMIEADDVGEFLRCLRVARERSESECLVS